MPKKIVKYTLDRDGKKPSFILDGGHFPKKNSSPPPQDFDLVGVCLVGEGDHLAEIETKQELEDYVGLSTLDTHNYSSASEYSDGLDSVWMLKLS